MVVVIAIFFAEMLAAKRLCVTAMLMDVAAMMAAMLMVASAMLPR